MKFQKLKGLIAAPFTPFDERGNLRLELIRQQADSLVADGVRGAYICGTTGEGISCSLAERMAILEAWKEAADGRLILIAHTGALSLKDVETLNRKAVELEFDAVSVIPTTFFKPSVTMDSNPSTLNRHCSSFVLNSVTRSPLRSRATSSADSPMASPILVSSPARTAKGPVADRDVFTMLTIFFTSDTMKDDM